MLNLNVITLFLVVVAATFSSAVKEKAVQKSRLMFEYDWPTPIKNLKRFPHPKSCSHFYLTKPDGSHVVKKCSGDEIFDYQSHRCKGQASAKCWKDAIEKITSKKVKEDFSCPFPWGLYPDNQDCSQFHECLSGRVHLRKCPASTLFDKVVRTCRSEKEAMCADQSDVVERDYRCPYKWGYFTHPKDCSKYYECLLKVPSIRTCERSMLFDNFQRRCMPKSDVKCGERFNPYAIVVSTENPETGSTKIRTEYPQTGTADFTADNSMAELKVVSTENHETVPARITSKTPLTTSSLVKTESPETGPSKVSTEYLQTGTADFPSGSSDKTEYEEVSKERHETGPAEILIKTQNLETGPSEVSTEYLQTGTADFTSDKTEYEEVSKDKHETRPAKIISVPEISVNLGKPDNSETGPEKISTDYPPSETAEDNKLRSSIGPEIVYASELIEQSLTDSKERSSV